MHDDEDERLLAYKIFSKLFYYPDEHTAELLLNGAVIEFLNKLQPEVSLQQVMEWLNGFAGEYKLLETLQVEYTGLFITSFPTLKAPLYKSFYSSKELFSTDAEIIEDIYAENNFEMNKEAYELPDHLAVELEFVFRLIDEAKSKELQRDFIKKHILSWTYSLKERISENASLPFYPYLINVTVDYLTNDIKKSDLKIARVKS